MTGFEGIGDFDGSPLDRHLAHQAAKGRSVFSSEAKPYPKSQQLARKERRYTRKVASPKRWQAIADAKQGPCRVCGAIPPNELHHVVSRAHSGADTEANIVPLCTDCHGLVTRRVPGTVNAFAASLDDREYAYAIQHGGEGFFERAYGLTYERAA